MKQIGSSEWAHSEEIFSMKIVFCVDGQSGYLGNAIVGDEACTKP